MARMRDGVSRSAVKVAETLRAPRAACSPYIPQVSSDATNNNTRAAGMDPAGVRDHNRYSSVLYLANI